MFVVGSDRRMIDGALEVNVWTGDDYRVLAGDRARQVTIPNGANSVRFEIGTKNPWTTHPDPTDNRTRSRCTPGNLHARISRSSDHGTYNFDEDAWVFVDVYHSDEFDACN